VKTSGLSIRMFICDITGRFSIELYVVVNCDENFILLRIGKYNPSHEMSFSKISHR
jgi:hypothetical protein